MVASGPSYNTQSNHPVSLSAVPGREEPHHVVDVGASAAPEVKSPVDLPHDAKPARSPTVEKVMHFFEGDDFDRHHRSYHFQTKDDADAYPSHGVSAGAGTPYNHGLSSSQDALVRDGQGTENERDIRNQQLQHQHLDSLSAADRKILSNQRVMEQLQKRDANKQRYPYFVYLATIVQIGVLVWTMFLNKELSAGKPQVDVFLGGYVQPLNVNPFFGPSPETLIISGARFVPCMRPVTGAQAISPPLRELCDFSGVMYSDAEPNQWFRFVTAIFVHGGIVHLISNLLFQVSTGRHLELEIGTGRFMLVYIISGIAGNVFGVLFSPADVPSVGASGALFGLVGVLLMDLLQNWRLIKSPWKELLKMAVLIGLAYVVGLLPGVDNNAHIGGFFGGILSGLVFLPRINLGKWDKRFKRLLVPIGLVSMTVLFAICLTEFYKMPFELKLTQQPA